MSDSCVLPEFDSAEAAEIARHLFALEGPMKQLHGERDLNFLIDDARGKFVFKIANAQESPAMLECQHQVFQTLAEAILKTNLPRVSSIRKFKSRSPWSCFIAPSRANRRSAISATSVASNSGNKQLSDMTIGFKNFHEKKVPQESRIFSRVQGSTARRTAVYTGVNEDSTGLAYQHGADAAAAGKDNFLRYLVAIG